MPIRIADDVRQVLEASTITAAEVRLPGEQLERKLYQRVDKVLKAAGGKWSRKAKAHVFKKDPREALGLALETGAITSEQQRLQAFYTPPGLAVRVAELAFLNNDLNDLTVLEPSAGEGALIKAAANLTSGWVGNFTVTAYDINEEVIPALRELGAEAEARDFLTVDPAEKKSPAYDRILMNPPFTRGQDVAHVLHALHFLAPGGRLVAIVSPSALEGSRKEQQVFQKVMKEARAQVFEVEAGVFRASGTEVATRIVVVDESPLLHAALIKAGLSEALESMSALTEELGERAETSAEREHEASAGQLDLFGEVA